MVDSLVSSKKMQKDRKDQTKPLLSIPDPRAKKILIDRRNALKRGFRPEESESQRCPNCLYKYFKCIC